MFILALTVLLMNSHVTFACNNCKVMTFEERLCDINTTVIRVLVDNVTETTPDGQFLAYHVKLLTTFKAPPIPVTTTDNGFWFNSPVTEHHCGFRLSENTEYFLTGTTDKNGGFFTSLCHIITPWTFMQNATMSVSQNSPLNVC